MSEVGKEMSFLEHLEELRWHLMRSCIAILIFTIAAFIAKDFVFGTIILGPSRVDFWTFEVLCQLGEKVHVDALCVKELDFKLQSRKMMGQFSMHLLASFVIGFIGAFPYVFWEIWRFLSPGLYKKERVGTRGTVFWVSLLFLLGTSFGYFVISPISINFFAGYSLDESIENLFDITNYVNTLAMIVMASGIMFQFPVVSYFLSKAGLIYPDFLKKYRKHALVIIFVVAAIITPPDPVSQIMIALPILVLYEISIGISRRVVKQRLKDIGFNEKEIE